MLFRSVNAFSEVSVKLNELTENFSTISTFINETAESYKAGDVAATKEVTGDKEKLNTSLSNESTANKSIDLNNIDKNSKVGKAVSKYSDELKNADYATVNDSIYTTTTTTTNSGNKDGDTSKDTGTTDNKETGVEDYFIALGTIGIAVTALLYVVDKKNVFKKI